MARTIPKRAREDKVKEEEAQASTAIISTQERTRSISPKEMMTGINRDWQFRLSTASPRSSLSVSDISHSWGHVGTSPTDVRPSRASSVISTRTKTSITTLHDDPRDGFDVRIGQEAVFRLGLDGSTLYVNQLKSRQSSHVEIPSSSWTTEDVPGETSDIQRHPQPPATPSEELPAIDIIARNPSFKPGPENITVDRRRASSNAASVRGNSSPPPSAEKEPSQLRRRGGIKLKLVTRDSSGQVIRGNSPLTPDSAASYRTIGSHSSPSGRTEAIEQSSPVHTGRRANDQPSMEDPGELAVGSSAPAENEAQGTGIWERLLKLRQEFSAGVVSSEARAEGLPCMSQFPTLSLASPLGADNPVYVDDIPIGSRPPPAMDDENDISIHYTRLIRSIDKSYRDHVQAKDQELGDARDMLGVLSRQALDLKAELIRTKSQVAAMSDPAHIRRMAREQTLEAQSFSFPPLKLNHVRTLKMALKRRAEKMKRGLDDDLGWLLGTSSLSSEDASKKEVKDGDGQSGGDLKKLNSEAESAAHSVPAQPGVNDQYDETELLQALLATRLKMRSVETEQQILQAQVVNLRETVALWKARYEKLAQTQPPTIISVSAPNHLSTNVEQARREVEEAWEEAWEARWRERHAQFTQRMKRIDEELQKNLGEATAERNERSPGLEEHCINISALLKRKDEEIRRLKSNSASLADRSAPAPGG